MENGFAILNLDSQSVISLNTYSENTAHIEQFITGFDNGTATVLYNEPIDMEKMEEDNTDVNWATFLKNS